LSLKHLAAKYPVKGLRLWGKIFGRTADYVIAEGTMDAEEPEEDAKDALGNTIQKSGEGPNKWVYFVSQEVGGEWTKLPNVTPHQIVVARKIRRAFTGKLSAPVAGHPPFPGTEVNYLRAQVALISAATVLAPSGAFTEAEDDPEGGVNPAEEWEGPDMTQAE
jgi:radial spoke head protein 4A